MPFTLPVQKRRLDRLFVAHALVSLVLGGTAFLLPHAFGLVFDPDDALWDWHPVGPGRVTHLIVRIYGALVLAQAWIVWNARRVSDGRIRRSFVQAYFVCFLLTFLALLRSQLTSGRPTPLLGWASLLLFAALSSHYGWFVFISPVTVFEGLDKAVV